MVGWLSGLFTRRRGPRATPYNKYSQPTPYNRLVQRLHRAPANLPGAVRHLEGVVNSRDARRLTPNQRERLERQALNVRAARMRAAAAGSGANRKRRQQGVWAMAAQLRKQGRMRNAHYAAFPPGSPM